MDTSSFLVIALVAVGMPALAIDNLGDLGDLGDLSKILEGAGDLSSLNLDLGGSDTSDLDNFINNGFPDDGYGGGIWGDNDDRYNGNDFRIYPVPVVSEGQVGSRHVSSVADLINLVFGLGGHVVGRAGWIVRDALGALFHLGSLVSPTVDAGLQMTSLLSNSLASGMRIASNLQQSVGYKMQMKGSLMSVLKRAIHRKMQLKRDGMQYSQYRLNDNDYGLEHRGSYGYQRSYPSRRSGLFDVFRQRFGRDDD